MSARRCATPSPTPSPKKARAVGKLTKLKQSHRIDLVVALGMACFAAVKAPRTTITVVNMDGQRLDPVTGNPIAPPRTRIRWTDANEDGVVTRTRVS